MPPATPDSPDPKPLANLARLLTQLRADAAELEHAALPKARPAGFCRQGIHEPKIPPSLTRALHSAQHLSNLLNSTPS